MNDISSTVGLMRREFRDAHSVVSRMDHQMRRLADGRSTLDRPGGLATRAAICAVLGQLQGRSAEAVAREHFATDCDPDRLLTLKAVTNPANTTAPPATGGEAMTDAMRDHLELAAFRIWSPTMSTRRLPG